MEDALREADRRNGNDGNIAQPYWDFTKNIPGIDPMPQKIRENFLADFSFPNDFFDGTESVGSTSRFIDRLFKLVRSGEQLNSHEG